jgi:hypothetical protein
MGWIPGKYKKDIKKPPGRPAVFGEIRNLFQVRSTLSTAAGAGEPKVAKKEGH